MADARIEWSGVDQLYRQLDIYQQKANEAVRQVALYWSQVLERHAKDNARWTDQTANARQSLHGYLGDEPPDNFSAADAVPYPEATDLARDVVSIYLAHGMSYGVFLELAHQGAYSIILETLEIHYNKIMDMMRGIFE